MASILVVEARVRRTSGPEQTGPEGHGGGHRGQVGDERSYHNPKPSSLFGLSHGEIKGWTWDFQPSKRAPTLQARGRQTISPLPNSRGCLRNATRTKQSFRGWPSRVDANLWLEQSSHRNALSTRKRVSPRQRAGNRSCIRHTSGSYRHRRAERQAGYQTKQYPGLVAGRAVGPAGVGDAPGNGRGPR